jgi:hypothetical protein
VVVNWGDGSAPQTLIAGDLTAISIAGGVTWSISAAHAYAEEGTYAYTVTVTDEDDAAATVSGSANIADAPLTAGSPVALTPNTGATISTNVGSFTDENPTAPTTDFIATINWGDGSSSAGTITQPGGVGTAFVVSGSHAYANPGNYNPAINILDVGGSAVTLTGSATVTDLPVTGTVQNFAATEGSSTGTIVLATFTDPNPLATVSDVYAFLPIGGWGDGTPAAASALTVTQIGGTSTSTIFQITGSHAYASTGSFPVNISVTTKGGATTNLTAGSATVTSSATGGVLAAGTTLTINSAAGLSTGTVVVGTFTDSNASAAASDYSAIIDWGDGSPTTIGTISFTPGTGGGPATVRVDGVHTYANSGTYTILVTTDSNGGQAVTTTAAANVASDGLAAVAIPAINATPNVSTGSVGVSIFTDTDYNAKAGDFSATINWGDGSDTSAGTVSVIPGTGGNPATVTINGSHTYASYGQYAIQVTTTSADGQSITTDATADVSAPHLIFLTQPTSTTAGQKLSTFKVEAVDASGNTVAADHSLVTLLGQPGTKANGKLLGNVTVRLNRGVATFSNVDINVADNYTIEATDGQYAAATSSSFTVTPSAVTHLVVSSVPTNAVHGSPFSAQVQLLDQYGNIVNNSSTVMLKLGKHPHGAALSGTTSIAASAGVANFSNLVINQAGIYSLIATDKPLIKAASGKFAIS